MDLLFFLSLLCSVLLGVGRAVDLTLFTDAETGLCLAGSVWWRYGALGVAVLLAVLAGRGRAARPEALCARHGAAGVFSLAGSVCFALAGALRLWLATMGVGSYARAVMELACAVWMGSLGRAWLRRGAWQRPTRGMLPAVLGSIVFYWCVLARFMENSSSWHRVGPTAVVWQMLAALVFLSALARALYLPQSANGGALCAGGLAAFCLCLCWEVPELAATLRSATLLDGPELLFGLGLCCVGALGSVCCAACAAGRPRHLAGKHGRPLAE